MDNIKKKTIGLTSAIFLGISSMVGSGWLFAPYKAAAVAGPASIFSWIIGCGIIWLLAMCFSEIASLYPRRGLSAIIPTLSHNKYFGFPFAIANWLGIVAVIALEADATIEYLINLAPSLKNMMYLNNHLTLRGDGLSVILVVLFCIANFWGAKMMLKTNNIFGVIKVVVPFTTVLMIVGVAFHTTNFTAINNSLVPYGYSSIFTAILTTGIIVAFNGFQSVISFSSEVKKPHINIPLSITIAIIVALAVYLLLQITFIGSMPASLVKQGWSHLQLNAPMVQLSGMLGLGLLTSIIYFGATICALRHGYRFCRHLNPYVYRNVTQRTNAKIL